MNDMYERRGVINSEIASILVMLGHSPREAVYSGTAQLARLETARLAARAEVLEREYATVSRIISAIESRAKAEEVQVLQGAICPDPTNAGSVQPVMCDPVSQG